MKQIQLSRCHKLTMPAGVLRPENQLAASAAHRPWGIRSLPWQPAKRSKKSPLHAKALAQTTSASSLPDTNGLAASKSATGNSTPNSRLGRRNLARSDTGRKESAGRLQ